MLCALCVTSGGNNKRYRLSVRLAGVFDSRVIVYMHCLYNVVIVVVENKFQLKKKYAYSK